MYFSKIRELSVVSKQNNNTCQSCKEVIVPFGFKTAEIVRLHKTCLTPQFLRLSLARFSREMACLPSRKNLANFPCLRRNIFVCKFSYIVCTNEIHSEVANLLVYCTYYDDSIRLIPKWRPRT